MELVEIFTTLHQAVPVENPMKFQENRSRRRLIRVAIALGVLLGLCSCTGADRELKPAALNNANGEQLPVENRSHGIQIVMSDATSCTSADLAIMQQRQQCITQLSEHNAQAAMSLSAGNINALQNLQGTRACDAPLAQVTDTCAWQVDALLGAGDARAPGELRNSRDAAHPVSRIDLRSEPRANMFSAAAASQCGAVRGLPGQRCEYHAEALYDGQSGWAKSYPMCGNALLSAHLSDLAYVLDSVDGAGIAVMDSAQRRQQKLDEISRIGSGLAVEAIREFRSRVLYGSLRFVSGYTAELVPAGDPVNTVCVAAFKGTSNLSEIVADLQSLIFVDDCRAQDGTPLGVCGDGFQWAYESLRYEGILDDLASRYRAGHCPEGVLVTGHSLGGAMALMMGVEIALAQTQWITQDKLAVYTFGQPRTFEEIYGYVGALPMIRRVMNEHDLITSFPHGAGIPIHSRHFGRPIKLSLTGGSPASVPDEVTTTYVHDRDTGGGLDPTEHLMGNYLERLESCPGIAID